MNTPRGNDARLHGLHGFPDQTGEGSFTSFDRETMQTMQTMRITSGGSDRAGAASGLSPRCDNLLGHAEGIRP